MDSAPNFASLLRLPTGACRDICVVPTRLNWHKLLGGRTKGDRGGVRVTHTAPGTLARRELQAPSVDGCASMTSRLTLAGRNSQLNVDDA